MKLIVLFIIIFIFESDYSFSATNPKSNITIDVEVTISTKNYQKVNDTVPFTIRNKIDSIFVKLFYFHQDKNQNELNSSIETITQLLKSIEKKDSVFCGIIQLHQAYYAGNLKESKPFIDKALINLKNQNVDLGNLYHKQFFWLIEGFYLENRQAEWEPVDNEFRTSLNKNKVSENVKFSIATYANLALLKKEYDIVNNLAKYDELYFGHQPSEDVNNKVYIMYSQWLQLKQRLEQWLEIPYSNRNQTNFQFNEGQVIPDYLKDKTEYNLEIINYDYKSSFTSLFKSLEELRNKTVVENKRSSSNYNENNRINYYTLHDYFIQDFYTWALHDHKQSEAILPIKRFLYEDIIEDDIPDALQAKKKPILRATSVTNLYKKLSQLYYEVGNSELAVQEIVKGFGDTEEIFDKSEQSIIALELYPTYIRAKRLEGNFEICKTVNDALIENAKKPEKFSSETLLEFEWYASARIEEIFTLMAQNKKKEVTSFTNALVEDIEMMQLPQESETLFYNTRTWTNLLYLTALISAQNGKWNSDLIEEMVSNLLQNHSTSEIFYPAQLLALKSKWINDKKLHVNYLQNLLLFTERQLKDNFIFLSAEERMQLYASKLNAVFDVYHELLFSGTLDAYPELKEKVLSQSLYLKNALSDGNSIENHILLNKNKGINQELLNELRSLKQKVKEEHQALKFKKIKTKGMLAYDKVQSMWLNIIEKSKEDLVKMANWKTISEKIKPNQIYLETVRFNRTLSDSSAVYGAYIISSDKKIDYFILCNEKELIDILNKENSSPQCESLKGTVARGSIGILSNDKKNSNFKNGDIDILGQLLLKEIWPYVEDKSELLMVHDGLLNRISFAALQWNEKFLINYLTLKHFSGSNLIGKNTIMPSSNSNVLLAGGLNYGEKNDAKNDNRLFKSNVSWDYLPGTKSEIEMLQPLFENAGYQSELVSGNNFTDALAMKLGDYSFIHLATHGFYFDTNSANLLYDAQYSRDAMNLEPLYRCGLAISGANNPSETVTLETSGFMMGYELANTDLRNCFLINLSACETGLGDLRNNLGVDGLSRALKIAGANHLLISLWKVPDKATALFMKKFYTNLFSRKTLAIALQDTQKEMSKTYPASAWAAFILVE